MPDNHRCGGCDNTWTGLRTCHCAACHRTFSGLEAFDRHRSAVGERGSCLDPALIVNTETDEPVLFLSGGVWRGEDVSEEELAERRERFITNTRRGKAAVR